MDYSILYENIEGLSKKYGMKMRDLEESLDISVGYISRCKNGRKSISLDTVCKLARIFNVSVDDLISKRLVEKIYSLTVILIAAPDDENEQYTVKTRSGHLLHVYSTDLDEVASIKEENNDQQRA